MRRHFRIITACFLLVSMVAGLCGCASDKDKPTVMEDSIDSNNQIVLNTVSMFGGTNDNATNYRRINDEFMKNHSGVIIDDKSQSVDQTWKTQMADDFATGNEPDVIQYFTDANATDVLAADKFVTISEIKEVFPDFASNIKPEAFNLTKNPDGIIRAVPTVGYWEGIFCNMTLFNNYGVALPTDWTSFLNAIEVFRSKKITPIAVSLEHVPHYLLEHLLLSRLGAEQYQTVPKTVNSGWTEALEAIQALREMGAFHEKTDLFDNDYANALFTDGKAAMIINGSWFMDSVNPDTTKICYFPTIEGGEMEPQTIIGGISTGFYITKKVWKDPEKRKLAVEFVEAHTSSEAIADYFGGTGIVAADIEMPTDLTLVEQSAYELVENAVKIVTPTDSRFNPQAYSYLIDSIVDVSNGTLKPRKLIKEMLKLNLD